MPAQGYHANKAACLDLALVQTGERNDQTTGTALEGVFFLLWVSHD